jgi:hypothetical protein
MGEVEYTTAGNFEFQILNFKIPARPSPEKSAPIGWAGKI